MSSQPLRLLFVAPYVPSLLRVRPYHLLRHLAARHEVTLFALTTSAEERAQTEALRRWGIEVHLAPVSRRAALLRCPLARLRGDPMQVAFGADPAALRQLARLVASRPFDLAHLEHARAAALQAALPPDLPVVFDAVDCLSLLLLRTLHGSHDLRQRLLAALELGPMRRFEASLPRRFARVLVSSPVDADALLTLARNARGELAAEDAALAPLLLPNGVDLEYFRPLPDRDPDLVVLSGRMRYHANATAALEFARAIWPRVRRARPNARLAIVGSEPPPEVRALAGRDGIEVTGYLPDLRPVVGRASVAVCPVRVKAGVQNKILEAMALGVAVVSSGCGVEGLAARPGHDLLVADEPEAFAAAVSRLLVDADAARALGERGRAYVVARHSWERSAALLQGCYIEVLAGRRSGVWLPQEWRAAEVAG